MGGPVDSTGTDRGQYWAKGTGFSTGSTNQTWDVDGSLKRQAIQEKHIIWIVRLVRGLIFQVRLISILNEPKVFFFDIF